MIQLNEDNKVSDEMQQLIVSRLGERQKKIERMQQMERSSKKRIMFPASIALVAACIIGFIFLIPTSQVSPLDELRIEPTTSVFRGSSAEKDAIVNLVNHKEYEKALEKTQELLHQSDVIITEINADINEDMDEESVYEEQQEQIENSDLRWLYIYLLVRNGKNEEAMEQINTYLARPVYAIHGEDAQALLKALKKNN